MNSKNQVLGFTQRTLKNLEHIEGSAAHGADVHVVTQIVNSLLGLIVLPVEKTSGSSFSHLRLEELTRQGWPPWTMERGRCSTLEELLKHLRNAAAHAHIIYSSESTDPKNVLVTVSDYKPKAAKPHWVANIRADALREFCVKFSQLIQEELS